MGDEIHRPRCRAGGEVSTALVAFDTVSSPSRLQRVDRLVAAGAAVQEDGMVILAGGDEVQAPSEPEIGDTVFRKAVEAELLSVGWAGSLGADRRQPWQSHDGLIGIVDMSSPAGQGGVGQNGDLDPGSGGESLQQIGSGQAVEIAAVKPGAERHHFVEFIRKQAVGRRYSREPRREGFPRQRPWPPRP